VTSPRPSSTRRAATGPATRSSLLEAARLGAAVAAADLAGRPDDAAPAYASWRRLRRRADRRARQLLRVAFDTGYGQARAQSPSEPVRR
jgi:hypothetical protein